MLRQRADPEYLAKIKAGRQAGLSSARHTPPSAEELIAARARMMAINARRSGLDKMPPWIPSDLVPDYLDFAKIFGEIDAGRRVKRLMREARE